VRRGDFITLLATMARPLAARAQQSDLHNAITRLDRLVRSARDLLNVITALAGRGAGFKSLKNA
jgi:DNA invertase Pin-like site-specific DNA recombinase